MKHTLFAGLIALTALNLLGAPAGAHISDQEKLVPLDGTTGDKFGTAVAIDGYTAAVSAPFHVDSGTTGAVYIFERNTNSDWPQMAKLLPTGAGATDLFGVAMALGDGYLAVSAPQTNSAAGAVYIFTGSGASWTQTQVLTASDAGPGHVFGNALAIDGDTLVIGAPGHEAAYVFRLTLGSWAEEQMLSGGGVDDLFGRSVAIEEDELLVGAPQDDTDAADAGSVFLYERSGTVWNQMLRLGSGTPGAGDQFGQSACISSLFIGVGAPFDDDSGADAGAAHYFSRGGPGGWTSEGTLTSPAVPTATGDQTGLSMAIDTNLFFIAQPKSDQQGLDSGGVQMFSERLDVITGDIVFPDDTTDGDALGASVAVSSCWMLSGAPSDDDLGDDSGAAYLFLGNPLTNLYCVPGISAAGCLATLSTLGIASASQDSGFIVLADGVIPGTNGLFFYGTTGKQQAPWGNGTSFQCVQPPVRRMGILTSIGTGTTCTGRFNQDLNATWCATCPKPEKNPGPGAEIYLQLWYRDPQNTSNQRTALSNAASIGVCP